MDPQAGRLSDQRAAGTLSYAVLTDQLTSHFGTPLVWTLIGVGLIALSLFVRGLLRQAIQAKSDRQALELLQRSRDDEAAKVPPYLVYLRAFETTGRLKQPWFIWIWTFGIQQLRHNQLETFMPTAVRQLGPLVALGEPGEHHGAGRIKITPREWKALV